MMNKRATCEVLTHEEINLAIVHFGEAQEMVLADRDAQSRAIIVKWIAEDVRLINPVYSLREDKLRETIDSIFTQPDILEFVLDLGFMFFTTWGMPNGALRLSSNLVEGLAMDGPQPEYSVIDDELMKSMSAAAYARLVEPIPRWKRWLGIARPITLQEFLASNKPLLVFYMLYICNDNAPAPAEA